ncbi:hypothetical protein CHUAL_010717 [Chamberlinius hualienensis]
MAPMWVRYGTVKVFNKYFYYSAVVINDKMYLLGFDVSDKNKTVISELDLRTFKMTKIISIDSINKYKTAFNPCSVCKYNENILIFMPDYADFPHQLVKINTKSHEVDEFPKYEEINNSNKVGQCVIEDNVYILFNNHSTSKLSILTVNLKTFEKKLIQSRNSPPNKHFISLIISAVGHEICCFNEIQPVIFVFNVVNSEWRKIEVSVIKTNDFERIEQILFVNSSEFVTLKHAVQPYFRKFIEILDFNKMQWRSADFLHFPQFDRSFTRYFQLNGNLAVVKNSPNSFQSNIYLDKEKIDLSNDDLEIYILDLNPSLKTLCSIRVLELSLDQSKLPKTIQNDLKQYINK